MMEDAEARRDRFSADRRRVSGDGASSSSLKDCKNHSYIKDQ